MEMGVENVRTGKMTVLQPLQKITRQRGFTGSSFASQHHQPAARFHSKHQLGDCRFVGRAGKKKSRIGRGFKRIGVQSKRPKQMLINRRCVHRAHRTPKAGAEAMELYSRQTSGATERCRSANKKYYWDDCPTAR